ncbi:unnamed protein product [Heligmosomoides polygyrus]|uniref:Reverse transcriptase domain-containing protein n=1 Tax=Heligmosomoides polygyrus TaxID=6339 RepID=A0A183F3H8_HELPZ|nr:unnamed protein product [Heligmosomoides polygyrus]
MRELEWEDMGVKVDGRQPHHLRLADDILLITPSISQAERMLAVFDRVCGTVGLQVNPTKTVFMRDEQVSDGPFSLNETNVSVCSSYVYLGCEVRPPEFRASPTFEDQRRCRMGQVFENKVGRPRNAIGREPSPTGFRGISRAHRDAHQRVCRTSS